MSVILKDNKGKLFIFSKGADSILLERMNKDNPFIADTWKNLEKFAEKGLRTLILCQKEISPKEYENWSRKYHVNLLYREKYTYISLNFIFLGCMHFNY
jgi:magnesium-transporting ATPase (P-type)